jgi:hypothetical protein
MPKSTKQKRRDRAQGGPAAHTTPGASTSAAPGTTPDAALHAGPRTPGVDDSPEIRTDEDEEVDLDEDHEVDEEIEEVDLDEGQHPEIDVAAEGAHEKLDPASGGAPTIDAGLSLDPLRQELADAGAKQPGASLYEHLKQELDRGGLVLRVDAGESVMVSPAADKPEGTPVAEEKAAETPAEPPPIEVKPVEVAPIKPPASTVPVGARLRCDNYEGPSPGDFSLVVVGTVTDARADLQQVLVDIDELGRKWPVAFKDIDARNLRWTHDAEAYPKPGADVHFDRRFRPDRRPRKKKGEDDFKPPRMARRGHVWVKAKTNLGVKAFNVEGHPVRDLRANQHGEVQTRVVTDNPTCFEKIEQ